MMNNNIVTFKGCHYLKLFSPYMISLFFCNPSLYAQTQTDSLFNKKLRLVALYAGGGFGLGVDGTPAGVGGTFILSNNWGGSFSFKRRLLRADNIPDDYTPAQSSGAFKSVSGSSSKKSFPKDMYDYYSLMIIREGTTYSKKVRYGVEIGPSVIIARTNIFTSQLVVRNSSILGSSQSSNYSTTDLERRVPGVSLRAKLEFPLSTGVGFEFALSGNINKIRPFAGVEIYLTLGFVREAMPSENMDEE